MTIYLRFGRPNRLRKVQSSQFFNMEGNLEYAYLIRPRITNLPSATAFIRGVGGGDNSRKIVPMSSPKLSLATRVAKPDKNGKILMIFQPTFRYSLRLSAEPVGPQIKRYLENQILFLNDLNVDLRRQTTLRLYSGEDHWAFKSRIEEEGYSELISDRTEPFWQQLKKSRILILTYNSTTLLEALTLNFPTLMFWDPKCWELNDRAKPWFESFVDLGFYMQRRRGLQENSWKFMMT